MRWLVRASGVNPFPSPERRRREVVPGDEAGQPVRLAEVQAVLVGDRHDVGRVRRARGDRVGEVTEEVLQAWRTDYLDHAGTVTCSRRRSAVRRACSG